MLIQLISLYFQIIDTSFLNFRWMRRFGLVCMHTFVISLCLLLTAANVLGVCIVLKNWIFYGYIVINYLSAYIYAIFVDPGTPPSSLNDTTIPHCSKCNLLKPERAHHCSLCGKCRLRYDHHCPFTGCVGLYNVRFFYKFLCTGCFSSAVSSLIIIIGKVCGKFKLTDGTINLLLFIVCLAFSILSVICTGVMITQHLNYVRYNQTTVEAYDNEYEQRQCMKMGLVFEYPYDHGLKKNIEELFGHHPLLFMIVPFWYGGVGTDGLSYHKAATKI